MAKIFFQHFRDSFLFSTTGCFLGKQSKLKKYFCVVIIMTTSFLVFKELNKVGPFLYLFMFVSHTSKNLIKFNSSLEKIWSQSKLINFKNIWVKLLKNGPSKVCGRQTLKKFTWSVLEYLDRYEQMS